MKNVLLHRIFQTPRNKRSMAVKNKKTNNKNSINFNKSSILVMSSVKKLSRFMKKNRNASQKQTFKTLYNLTTFYKLQTAHIKIPKGKVKVSKALEQDIMFRCANGYCKVIVLGN